MTKISEVRDEIWELVQVARSMQVVHWYVALDDCFENDELLEEDLKNMKWRLWVLKEKGEPISGLAGMIDRALDKRQKRILMEKESA